MIQVLCSYCLLPTSLVKGVELYGRGHELAENQFYYCSGCKAWVGVHKHDLSPMGTLAKGNLRKHRTLAHEAFDPIWKCMMDQDNLGKQAARNKAYAWLGEELDIPLDKCHIAMFDVAMCKKVVRLCKTHPTQV